MDFDLVLYIILIIGSIALSVIKTFKTDEKERQAKKNKSRPIVVETSDGPIKTKKKNRATTTIPPQEPQEDEYFTYETISDRDFAKEFGHNLDETTAETATATTTQPEFHPDFDKKEVLNGIIWSEILKRKY